MLVLAVWVTVAWGAPGEVPPRDAHTVELGAGALPACLQGAAALDPCKAVVTTRVHGDHRLARGVLVAWDLTGVRRSWFARDTVQETGAAWRTAATVGVGWHTEAAWGDMRLWAGPSVEWVGAEPGGTGPVGGVPWLDPVSGSWTDVGLVIGNDLDWPVGPVRIGLRYRFRGGVDVAGETGTSVAFDVWELHAASLAVPVQGPVGAYAELGWTNEFTVPLANPDFRVAPWLFVGVQIRGGTTGAPVRD